MIDKLADLTAAVRTRVEGMGFDLAYLQRSGSSSRSRLQVRIDRPNAIPGRGVTIEDCATVSRGLEEWLDQSGLLGPRYNLEVSSPGIERPVRWREHWERFAGRDVNVKLNGHGRVRATIIRVTEDGDSVVLRPTRGESELTVRLAEARDATLAVDCD